MDAGLATDIQVLLENGVPLVESQKDLTPFQRQVLVKEIKRQNEKEQEYIDQNSPDQAGSGAGAGPSSMKGISGKPNAKSSKIQAIKQSQEDEENFYNKSLVDNE